MAQDERHERILDECEREVIDLERKIANNLDNLDRLNAELEEAKKRLSIQRRIDLERD